MDLLYDAAAAWSKLMYYRYDIICGKKKKLYPITLDFEETEFYHLAGFPHMKDITFPVRFSKRAALKKVLDSIITEGMISKSESFEKTVKSKLLAITHLEQLLNGSSKVYLYDPSRLTFYTDIEANYLLADESSQVAFLFTDTEDMEKTFFPRSAFMMDDRDFRTNQSSMAVLQIKRTNVLTGLTETQFCREGFSEEQLCSV